MTDNIDLIAEARDIWEADDLYPDQMIPRLVKALEAADQRAMQAEAELRDVWRTDIPSLKDARDQLAAVVEKAEDYVTRHYLDMRFGDEVLPILATAPADALREHDAKVRAKAVRDARDEMGVYVGDEDSEWWDGYRNGQRRQNTALGEYADRIEREAGLK